MVARSQLLIVVFAVGRGAREVPAWCHRSVESVAFFSAIHKSGTTLAAEGGLCFNAFLDRADVPIGVKALDRTSAICRSNFPAKISQSVTWTRDPFDWIVSNYMYDRRGDEKARWFPAVLGDPVFAADLAASLPGFNYSALPGEKFDAWLKRLPLVEGLAFELFIRMAGPKGTDYRKGIRTGIQTIGAFAGVSRGARIGADAAPSSEGRPGVSVCLEDFMSDPARTHRTWRNVLQAVAPGAVPDAVLEQCIADHDTTASQATFLNNTRSKAHPHGTYRTVSPTELDGMLKMARGLDAGFLGGTYAAAAQRIGCNTTRAARRRFV